jgi:hypothetical protein
LQKFIGQTCLELLVLLVGTVAMPVEASGWGDEGHMIVALIANQFLAPTINQRVDALLQADDDPLTAKDIASRALWADRYRDSDRNTTRIRYNATQKWHYIDIEISAPHPISACSSSVPAGKSASEGPAEDCVVNKIDQFWKELKDQSIPQTERILALKYLLHFVGDLHQPLHAADNRDRGGNCEQVVTTGGHQTPLHTYWDVDVVSAIGPNAVQVARVLKSEIVMTDAVSWSSKNASSWAQESFQEAKLVAYTPELLAACQNGQPVGTVRLDAVYEKAAAAVARTQLKKAGVRLAMVLNDALQ